MPQYQIKSSALMFTDIVGYSSMMGRDESHSLTLLDEHNRIVEPVIEKYSGEIIKYIGDSIFARFDKPDNAVRSAVEFQSQFKERNRLTKRKDKIPLRVGIHLGTVVEKDGDVFGNDVNITSRIEGAAPLEGIAVSSEVIDVLQPPGDFFSRKMGYVKLKNIRQPQLIYKVYLDQEDLQAESDDLLLRENVKRGLNIVDIERYQVLDTFSLAFLEIQVESNDPDARDYAHILTRDIIGDFQTVNNIRVPSINEIQDPALQGMDKTHFAFKLKVNNILECRLRFLGDEIEFSARLFSNISGEYVWQNAWKCKHENTNFIRFKLLTELAQYFDLDLPEKLRNALSREMTDNSIALKKYIEGRTLIDRLSNQADLQKAFELLGEAVALDENFVEAYAKYAFACMKLGYNDKCEEVLEDALEIADDTGNERGKIEVFNYFGAHYGAQYKLRKAQKNLEQSLKILRDFNDQSTESRVLYNLAGAMYLAGKPDKALTYLDRSRELKINLEEYESLAQVDGMYGNVYTLLNDHSKAIECRERAVAQCRDSGLTVSACKNLVALSGTYQKIGAYQLAEACLEEAETLEGSSFEKGKIPLIRARIAVEKNKYKKAEKQLKAAEEQFQKRGDTRLLVNTYLDYSQLYIQKGEGESAAKYIDLAREYRQKIRGDDLNLLPECMAVYVDHHQDEDGLDKLQQNLNELKDSPLNYRQWHFLAGAYDNIGNNEKASECRKISRSLLKELIKCNSKDKHSQSMLKNHWLHRKILN